MRVVIFRSHRKHGIFKDMLNGTLGESNYKMENDGKNRKQMTFIMACKPVRVIRMRERGERRERKGGKECEKGRE
jgi:hypothetical protein